MEPSQLRLSLQAADGRRRGPDATGEDLLVVSNRQPYRHFYDDGDVAVDEPAGGLTAGLDAVLRRIDGTWIAWGDGEADAEVADGNGCVTVPPDAGEGRYTLRRLWLTDEQVENYYYGFSNRVLWPVCHSALTNVECEGGYWEHYRGVNERFADAVAADAGASSIVWLHDYHFALAPRLVRDRVPDGAFVAHTWHVPWPSWDVFRGCPHARELVDGLLGNDLLGFHVPRYCENFLRCVGAAVPGAHVDWDNWRVVSRNRTTTVRAFPMGVPADAINRGAASEDAESFWQSFGAEHGIDESTCVGVGVDRLDYSKGIPQRIAALERLWESRPRWREAFTYVQVGTESRTHIPAYEAYQDRVEDAIARVNDRFGTDDWEPVVYTTDMLDDEELYGLYRFADLGIVSPIRDGMNLVCQEYVAAQQGTDGVLVLSDQAGAHDELGEWAVTINPHDVAAFADALDRALTMAAEERASRMDALRRHVATNDIDTWIREVFGTIEALRTPRARDHRHASV